ncbi:MAG: hypothetical protein ACKN9T_06335 [Candidatus Methylumidiphilus sp.]
MTAVSTGFFRLMAKIELHRECRRENHDALSAYIRHVARSLAANPSA